MIPFFSVLIPVFNVEKYLKQCVDSVLQQTFCSFEIILVDDGSTDGSDLICDEYAKDYPDLVRTIHKVNEGSFSARRVGLKHARGQVIVFVDSDDFISDRALQRIHEVFQQKNADIVVYKWRNVDTDGRVLPQSSPSVFQEGYVDKESFFQKMLMSSALNSLCLKACKRALYDIERDYCAYYKRQNGEDLLQSLPVVAKAVVFYYLDEELYFYRTNPLSLTHRYQPAQYKVLNVVRPKLFQYMCDLGYDSADNRIKFYRMYLSSLSVMISRTVLNVTEGINEILAEILTYDHVGYAREYIHDTELPIKDKLILCLFYQKHWRVLGFGIRLMNIASNIKRRVFG